MAWNAYITESSDSLNTLCQPVLFAFTLLMILTGTFQTYTKKNLNQSQFTLPPTITISPITNNNCNTHLINIENAIECFERKLFDQAQTILNRIQQNAIQTKNNQLLLTSHLYLVFIAIESGKIKAAKKRIQHIFFLHPNVTLNQYGVNKKKYSIFFHKIKQQGRRLNEIEIDEITKKKFIRVKFCNNHCRNEIWLESIAHKAESNINTDLDCSLRGNCNPVIGNTLDCSITGDCDTDLDCSLDGTC